MNQQSFKEEFVGLLLAGSPPNGVELMPPRPKEGAEGALEIELVVRPVNVVDAVEAAVPKPPKPKVGAADDEGVVPKPRLKEGAAAGCCCCVPKPKEGADELGVWKPTD